MIVAENEPDEPAAILAGVVVNVVVPSFIVIVAPTVKPVPEMVTVVPATPDVGESVIEVATTVNVAD